MATVYKEFTVEAPADDVWAAFRDVGAIHTRLAREFVTNTQLDGDSRLVTFVNGATVRELIISIDDERRRLAYSVTEWQATHHNASFQVFVTGPRRSRVVWVADFLPNELGGVLDGLMEQGTAAMRATLSPA